MPRWTHSFDPCQRARLDRELTALYVHVDSAYTDKLDGKIPKSFWPRKLADWQRKRCGSNR